MEAQLLELLWQKHEEGETCVLLTCESSLPSCPANARHESRICAECLRRSSRTSQFLLPPDTKVLKLGLPAGPIQRSEVLGLRTIQDLAGLTWGSMPVGELVLNQLSDDISDTTEELRSLNKEARILSNLAINLYERAKQVIVKESISRVYVWNGRRPSDGPLLYAAKDCGLEYFAYHWNAGDALHVLPALKVQSISAQNSQLARAKNQFVEGDVRLLDGHQFYEHQRFGSPQLRHLPRFGAQNAEVFEANSTKPIVAMFVSTPSEYASMADRVHPCKVFNDPFDFIRRINDDEEIQSNKEFVVRWHPNMRFSGPTTQAKIQETVRATPSIKHILPDSKISSYALLEQAEAILTSGSTIGVEALYWGVPSILAGRAYYEELDSITKPADWVELKELLLKSRYQSASQHDALVYAHHFLVGNTPISRAELESHQVGKFMGVDLTWPSLGVRLRRMLSSLSVTGQRRRRSTTSP
mgnify:CR=1 FL=1